MSLAGDFMHESLRIQGYHPPQYDLSGPVHAAEQQ